MSTYVCTSNEDEIFQILQQNHDFYLQKPNNPKEQKEAAVRIIQRNLINYTSRNIYKKLRDKLYQLSRQDPIKVLRQVDRVDAAIFDKKLGYRLVFRLGGCKFPPVILCKIFICTGGTCRMVSSKFGQNSYGSDDAEGFGWKLCYKYKGETKRKAVSRKAVECRNNSRSGFNKRKKKQKGLAWIEEMYHLQVY